MMKLDSKFYGQLKKVKDDSVVPDDMWMAFLTKDNAFPPTLEFYRNECRRLGCDHEQLAAVDRTKVRLHEWRRNHPDLLKRPDAMGEKLLDQVQTAEEVVKRTEPLLPREPSSGQLWLHKKTGHLYTIVAFGRMENNLNCVIVYQRCSTVDSGVWVRPLGEFLEEVADEKGSRSWRFVRVS